MLRNILLTIGGFILCLLAIAFSGWIHLHFTDQGKWSTAAAQKGGFLSEKETVEMFGESREAIFNRAHNLQVFIMLPLVAMIVGMIVGMFSRSFVWLAATVSLIPLHLFNLDNILLLVLYLILGIVVSFLAFRFVQKGQISAFFGK